MSAVIETVIYVCLLSVWLANAKHHRGGDGIRADQHIWGKSQRSCCLWIPNDLQKNTDTISTVWIAISFFIVREEEFHFQFETLMKNEQRPYIPSQSKRCKTLPDGSRKLLLRLHITAFYPFLKVGPKSVSVFFFGPLPSNCVVSHSRNLKGLLMLICVYKYSRLCLYATVLRAGNTI